MKINQWFFLGIIGVTLLGFVGFTIFAKEQRSVDKLEENATASAARGETSENVVFPLLNGSTISLADYRGEKPIILDFFATWCPNCRRNTPHLNELYKKYKDQVEIIAVNLHEDPAVVRQFADSYNLTFPIALDETSSIANQFGVRYTNTHVFIDLNGTVLRVVSGDVQERDIQILIKR